MDEFLQPNSTFLALLLVKTTLYLPSILLLALWRAGVAKSPARLWAGLAACIAALGLCAQFGPALIGSFDGALVRTAFAYKNAGAGYVPLASASLPLLVSAFAAGSRHRTVDAAHLLLIVATSVLWMLAR